VTIYDNAGDYYSTAYNMNRLFGITSAMPA
jgi:hypothetical protein